MVILSIFIISLVLIKIHLILPFLKLRLILKYLSNTIPKKEKWQRILQNVMKIILNGTINWL